MAELFGEDRRTVQRWVKRFETHSLDGLREGERLGRPTTLDARQWAKLGRELRRNPREFGHAAHLWDGKQLAEHLRQRYKVALGVRQCQRIPGQLGFRLRKPRPQVAEADPERVAAFKKLHRLANAKDVELWSLDECHFQQHGTWCRMWAPPEIKDPVLSRAPTRKSVACFGAVSLASDKFVRALCDKFDAATFEIFLKKLLRHRTRGKRMVIVLDNARYHHAVLLAPLRRRYRKVLTLLFLPPYSQQLAPIEHVWKLTRRDVRFDAYLADPDRPQHILEEFCRRKNIRFVDTTSALRERNKAVLVYFLREGHLNHHGSEVVARVLQKAITAEQ